MTHPLSNLRVRTITINRVDVTLPPRTCLNLYPPLPIKPCLDMTSFDNILLLFIAMTHARCGLYLCTVTINSGVVLSFQTCSGTYSPTPVTQTLSRHEVIWQFTVTIYSDDSYIV